MKQTWDDIFKMKTSHQLYKILLGGTINEKVLAKKILNERNFDFNNIEKYKDEWELERLIKVDEEIYRSNNNFNRFPWFGIWSVAPIIAILIVIMATVALINQIVMHNGKDVLGLLLFIGLSIGFYYISIAMFRKNKNERTKRKARIDYLKNKLREKDN